MQNLDKWIVTIDATIKTKSKHRNTGANRHYESNIPNRYLQSISPKNLYIFLPPHRTFSKTEYIFSPK